ncbi:MAG: hypothetical protein FWC38_06665 [Proteobacteria bacterium]|nr:hypothetical protein [Pseudomonadota bacterium]MCL2307887.1 hypothetical protein [Pseudomonadota bacterium]
MRDYYDRWGVFPADNAEAGLHAAEHYIGSNTKSILVERGVILITLNDRFPQLNGQKLHLIPAINSASPTAPFAWVCEGATPPVGTTFAVEIPEERLTLPSRSLPAPCRSNKPRS